MKGERRLARKHGPGRGVQAALVRHVDGASPTVLRTAVRVLLVWGVLRDRQDGWIADKSIEPHVYFSYCGLDFIQPWPGPWVTVHFALIVAAAAGPIAIALSLRPQTFPGDVAWTEEGHRFSWRTLLRSKDAADQ